MRRADPGLVFEVAVIHGSGGGGGKALRFGECQGAERHLSITIPLSIFPSVQILVWPRPFLFPFQ